MRLPKQSPGAVRRVNNVAVSGEGGVNASGCFTCCLRKKGFAACLARCEVTGQCCDGGLSNCQSA